jgi:hypothetical protein
MRSRAFAVHEVSQMTAGELRSSPWMRMIAELAEGKPRKDQSDGKQLASHSWPYQKEEAKHSREAR